MTPPLDIVIFGLSISSAWGNGHATTWRALIDGLAGLGHRVTFVEREQPWYAAHRDLPRPGSCELILYDDPVQVLERLGARLAKADSVLVGSYVPDAIALIDRLARLCPGRLSFYDIDTPVTLAHLDSGDAPYLARRQLGLFQTVFSFAGGPALHRLQALGAGRARPLYCSVDPRRYPVLDVPRRWDLGYLGTHSDDRLPGLRSLLLEPARRRPDLRFVVAGPQYPADIDWPANVERIEHLPPDEHPAFYAAQRFTLNLTRAPMRALGHAPSVRLFEAGSCATPVISDDWAGLAALFPEAVIAADADQVLAALEMGGDARRWLGQTARARVLEAHTGAARAAELVSDLTEPVRLAVG